MDNTRQGDVPHTQRDEKKARAVLGLVARQFHKGMGDEDYCRFRCERCRKDELVTFSCKGRVLYSSCDGTRMANTAAYLVDRLLPTKPIRRWVLTLPFRIRYLIAFDKKMCAEGSGSARNGALT